MKHKPAYLSKLTQDQLEAVTYNGKRLMIVAGAGTGKTTVITSRIAWLIEQGVKPEQILALTFTDKAANEMEERVDQLLPYGVFGTTICTFHRLGKYILDRFPEYSFVNDQTRILSEIEQKILFHNHIMDFPLNKLRPVSNPYSSVEKILHYFSRLKDELITPELFSKHIKKENDLPAEQPELAHTYAFYQQLLLKLNLLDYGELQLRPYLLLKNHPVALQKLHQQYRYILVDEYQDTNHAQIELIKLLVGDQTSLTVVGDDDQSIYQFRGASFGQMSELLTFYADTKIISLTDNFRSKQYILDNAYALICHNNPNRLEFSAKISKKLISKLTPNTQDLVLPFYTFSRDEIEAEWIANNIITATKSGLALEDQCILVRANTQAKAITQALDKAGIPYITKLSGSLDEDKLIHALIMLFTIALNPKDFVSFYHLATSPIYRLPSEIIVPLMAEAKHHFKPMEELVTNNQTLADTAVSQFLEDILWVRREMVNKSTSELIVEYLKNRQILAKYLEKYFGDISKAEQSVIDLLQRVKQFEAISKHHDLIEFMDNRELLLHNDENTDIASTTGGVRVFTVHAAKGLEFDSVYITNLIEGRFPGTNRSNGFDIPTSLLPFGEQIADHIEEERRLFYVALTRAKNNIYLTRSQKYNDGVKIRSVSRFITELININEIVKTDSGISPNPNPIITTKAAKAQLITILTPHSLADYEYCPFLFKLQHIDKMPRAESAVAMAGSLMHHTFEYYFTERQNNTAVSLEKLEKYFNDRWSNSGYQSELIAEAKKVDCLRQIANFYHTFSQHPQPTDIEKEFKFPFDKYFIKGRMDFILQSANTKDLQVIDFKTTGKVVDVQTAEAETKKSLQMMVYAYHLYRQYNLIPKATVYYANCDILSDLKLDLKIMDKIENRIRKITDAISAQEFRPNASWHICQYCAMRNLCPYAV